jgi:hypothetical protein
MERRKVTQNKITQFLVYFMDRIYEGDPLSPPEEEAVQGERPLDPPKFFSYLYENFTCLLLLLRGLPTSGPFRGTAGQRDISYIFSN